MQTRQLQRGLIIFDLDGTLIDSAQDIVNTTNELMHSRGRAALAADVIVAAIGEGLMPLVYSCFPEAREDSAQLTKISEEFAAVYERHLLKTTTVFPGIEPLLERTTHQIAIVTNKRIRWTHETLHGLGLDRFPWVRVFGVDSLSQRKPHPLPLLEAMKAAGTTARNTVMVGDGLPDVGAARAAGVPMIACGYGYCAVEKLLAAGATGHVNSPSDLAAAIETLFEASENLTV